MKWSLPQVAGVIPAKSSSRRVEGKNNRLLLGVPLFLVAAANLGKVLEPSSIYVDTDSPEMAARARAAGFRALLRPAELATNATDGNALLTWEASAIEAEVLVQHLPPMPFCREATLRKGIEAVLSGRADSAFGASDQALYLWHRQPLRPQYDLEHIPNSFTLPRLLVEGMGLYVTRRDVILSRGTRVGERPEILELDRFEQIDIDEVEDLELARAVATGLDPDSEYVKHTHRLAAFCQRAETAP
ncbi:MAG: hypothetical protein Q9Q40_05545 [Acidobacteriota bacterium]|nr:hypothetical protein [Acidobacteriota bacterium]MDQ7087784.1 hypothetical protein [Acidobacteriota bacterium]